LGICDNLNIPIVETPVLEAEIPTFDEMIIIGTTVEITPVVQVNDHIIGSGQPGPLTRKIQHEFFKLVSPKPTTILEDQNEKYLFDFFRK
jgi:branched-subunit amino acid aminotransferase/4-amino-4-deoxychorismate lyase